MGLRAVKSVNKRRQHTWATSYARLEFVGQLPFLVLVLDERQLHREHRLDELEHDTTLFDLDQLAVDLINGGLYHRSRLRQMQRRTHWLEIGRNNAVDQWQQFCGDVGAGEEGLERVRNALREGLRDLLMSNSIQVRLLRT